MQGELGCNRRLPEAWSTNSGALVQQWFNATPNEPSRRMQLFSVLPDAPPPNTFTPAVELPVNVQLFSTLPYAPAPNPPAKYPLVLTATTALPLKTQLFSVQ